MNNTEKAKQEFTRKLDEVLSNSLPGTAGNAKEYVIYEKLLTIEKSIEELKNTKSIMMGRVQPA